MKIGMMTDNYQTHISGVTNYISVIQYHLANAGHEVYVFTFDKNDSVDKEKNIVCTAGLPLTDFYINVFYNRSAQQLLSTMDIVHVHHPFMSGLLARRYCRPRHIPIVFTNHTRYDLYSKIYLPIIPQSASSAILKAYLSRFYRSCALVIISSASMRSVMAKTFGSDTPLELIPYGLDLQAFSNQIQPLDRIRFGFSAENVICLYVGRLSPEKNLPFLIEAFARASSDNDSLRLLLVGDGPERKQLETLVLSNNIASKVHFTGMVEYKDVPSYLVTSDFSVNPSTSETFGLTTVEAMATGLPVLGVDAPGTRDIISDGINGILSPSAPDAFITNLLMLATHSDLRQRIGHQARLDSKKYDIQNHIQILTQHYQRLIEAVN